MYYVGISKQAIGGEPSLNCYYFGFIGFYLLLNVLAAN